MSAEDPCEHFLAWPSDRAHSVDRVKCLQKSDDWVEILRHLRIFFEAKLPIIDFESHPCQILSQDDLSAFKQIARVYILSKYRRWVLMPQID